MTHDLRTEGPVSVAEWVEVHSESFSPPICNKLMHKEHLSIMFVGGPNTRTDFHLDESPEFFWQMKGNMKLPIIERGEKKVIEIKEGEVFLLPSRIPHSPQRPEANSLGLVIERARVEGKEFDGLRWYTDFEKCDEVLWEKYFYCGDLGRDLVPVVEEFRASEAFATGRPTPGSVIADPPLRQDYQTIVPRPFSLNEWLEEHSGELSKPGARLSLFGDDHPEQGFKVVVLGAGGYASPAYARLGLAGAKQAADDELSGGSEAFLYVVRGKVAVSGGDVGQKAVNVGECFVLAEGKFSKFRRSGNCIALLLTSSSSS
ncbi:3-hydroxyanthranilic acid dioxygenase [Perkinsus olseni]|uniref:3-hydroxyanthranilate 3,4-dioxygenase n=1 Tax=Perkinsus olseni TaxID=32597 RepID=A0A7J6PNM7_PEROL|nr:3-hydroxyanthranilic acid dioxygenase [Perkinsus olseni]